MLVLCCGFNDWTGKDSSLCLVLTGADRDNKSGPFSNSSHHSVVSLEIIWSQFQSLFSPRFHLLPRPNLFFCLFPISVKSPLRSPADQTLLFRTVSLIFHIAHRYARSQTVNPLIISSKESHVSPSSPRIRSIFTSLRRGQSSLDSRIAIATEMGQRLQPTCCSLSCPYTAQENSSL